MKQASSRAVGMPGFYIFQNSTKLISGIDALEHLSHELGLRAAKRPMIISDKTLQQLGLVDRALTALTAGNVPAVAVYAGISADAPVEQVDEAARMYREQNCDSLIAVGGGSVLDAAKGVRMVAASGVASIRDLMGYDRLQGIMPTFIAVPTTSGTGSEATQVAVLADHDARVKREYASYLMLPDAAILDPVMTLSLPPAITAATGMDALVHAIEAYSGRQQNPLSRAHAAAAVQLIGQHLLPAVMDGTDRAARHAMANASFMAGAAFSNSMVGGVHALGHAVGAVARLQHGEVMNILLPHVMRFNLEDPADSSVARDYAELGFHLTGTPGGADDCINAITGLQADLEQYAGLPRRLRDREVLSQDFPAIIEKAWLDGSIITNPRELTRDNLQQLLQAAW